MRNSHIETTPLVPTWRKIQRSKLHLHLWISRVCWTPNSFDNHSIRPVLLDMQIGQGESKFWLRGSCEHCIILLKLLVSHLRTPPPTEFIQMLKILRAFYETNERIFGLPFEIFYIRQLSERIDIKSEFLLWTKGRQRFNRTRQCSWQKPITNLWLSFHSVGTEKKALILRVENNIRMRHELQDAFFRALFARDMPLYGAPPPPRWWREWNHCRPSWYSWSQNWSRPEETAQGQILSREEAVDEGGVQKEFFQLVNARIVRQKVRICFVRYPSSSFEIWHNGRGTLLQLVFRSLFENQRNSCWMNMHLWASFLIGNIQFGYFGRFLSKVSLPGSC